MSLVICSNVPNEESVVATETSIFKPFQFRNHLGSTLTIPKNSEVALQSAKINLDGSILVGDGQRIFFQYFGFTIPQTVPTQEPQTIRGATCLPIRTTLFEGEGTGLRKVSNTALARETQKAMNINQFHTSMRNKIQVVEKVSATGVFQGYTITYNTDALYLDPFDDLTNVSTQLTPKRAVDAYSYAKRYNGATQHWEYIPPTTNANPVLNTGGNFKIATNQSPTQSVMCNCPPIVSQNGCVTYDMRGVIGGSQLGFGYDNPRWMVGLSRASVGEVANTGRQMRGINPPYYKYNNGGRVGGKGYQDWLKMYCDFSVYCDMSTDSILRVGQCIVDSQDNTGPVATRHLRNFPVWKTFAYDERNGVPADYDMGANTLGFTHIQFRTFGERIEIYMLKENVSSPTDMSTWAKAPLFVYNETKTDGSGNPRDKAENLKPIGLGCWAMYPMMAINNRISPTKNRDGIKLTNYTCSKSFFATGNVADDPSFTTAQASADYGWFPQTGNPNRNFFKVDYQLDVVQNGTWNDLNQLENNAIVDLGISPAVKNPYVYIDSDRSAPFQFLPTNVKPVLIFGQSSRYTPTTGASGMELYGFQGRNVVECPGLSAAKKYSIDSANVPSNVADKSIFVRLEGLAPTSTNARQGGRSSIIAHLPRFDGGRNTGSLFLEPANMVYLDLKNPADLKLNQFDISLCYSDETLATSLVGATIIVLHFREKK